MHTKTIIPQQDKGLIVEIADKTVSVLSVLEIPYNSISKIIDNETIVTLDKDEKRLLLHTIGGGFIQEFVVPFGIAMNVKDHTVYVGGDASGGEVCYMLDLKAKEPALVNIDLPVPMVWGKAVDDILIVEDIMLLIDNLVFPKYTFTYDISNPTQPQWINTTKLPYSKVYENILKGDMNEDWMIYLSTSSDGWTGDEAHITIEGRYNNEITSSGKKSILDICLVGDTLYVLTDIGLGLFDLNRKDLSAGDIALLSHNIVADRIVKVDDKRLLLVSRYAYELIDLVHPEYFNGGISERFWSYAALDLSGRKLVEFPDDKIENIETLEHLDLSSNDLKKFPSALRQCKKLRSLNINGSGITKIPKWLEELEMLEELNIAFIDIDSPIPFMPSQIRLPKKLRRLDLSFTDISAIPPSVLELKNLEYLNLTGNNIKKLPKGIMQLKKLKDLEIDWSNIVRFPENIKDLPVKNVSVKGQQGKIPDVIYAMTNLEHIEATSASISELSPKITGLTKLTYLNLESNSDLLELPENIGDLQNLEKLGLAVCGLEHLPESLCKLRNLEVLHLQYNKLTALPENIGKLTKLKKLDLDSNELSALPQSFSQLSSLTSLLLSRNKLTTLPKGIAGLKNIKKVELWSNTLSVFPEALCTLKQLTIIELWDNNIQTIPKELGSLEKLSILNLNGNQLTQFPDEIGKLKELEELNLNKNKLMALPESLGDLKSLTKLSVEDNALSDLPESLFDLMNLEELALSNNQLEVLPESISQLTALKKLTIEGNAFTTLPDSIVNLKNIYSFPIPDYVFTFTPAQYAWLQENKDNSDYILTAALPLPAPS